MDGEIVLSITMYYSYFFMLVCVSDRYINIIPV